MKVSALTDAAPPPSRIVAPWDLAPGSWISKARPGHITVSRAPWSLAPRIAPPACDGACPAISMPPCRSGCERFHASPADPAQPDRSPDPGAAPAHEVL